MALAAYRSELRSITDLEVMALARRMAASDAKLTLVAVQEIPLSDPMDRPETEVEAAARRWIDVLRKASDKKGAGWVLRLVRARSAGRAICRQAAHEGCDAVLLYVRVQRKRSGSIFGQTVEYVLRHAPCDVAVLSYPPPGKPYVLPPVPGNSGPGRRGGPSRRVTR